MGFGHGSPLWVSMAAIDVRAARIAAPDSRRPPRARGCGTNRHNEGRRPRLQEATQGRHEACPRPQAAAHQQSDGSPVHSCTRSTHVASDAERHGPDADREPRHPGHRERSGFAQREPPSVSRPVSGLASGISCGPHLPAPAGTVVYCGRGLAYRCVGSAGLAFVSRTRTGFPFHPRTAADPGAPETWRSLRGPPAHAQPCRWPIALAQVHG